MSEGIARPGGQLIAQAGAGPLTTPGVVDLYREVFAAASAFARRWRLEIVTEIALVVAYFTLRTIGADAPALPTWLIAAAVVAVVSPTSGLVVLAAIAPFNEGIAITRDIGSKTMVAAAVLAGIVVRWVLDPSARIRPRAPVLLAGGLIVASGLSLIRSWQRWGTDFAQPAAEIWLQGVATMLVVFIASVWVARRGELRPLIVAIIATTVAGLISLADFVGGDATMRDSFLGWLVVGQFNPTRLTGVIRSPTSTAALVMLPITVFIVAAILGRDIRLRIGAAILALPLLLTAYLTFNRAVFLGLYILAVVVGWRIRRWLGIALLVGGLVLGALLLPTYQALRGGAVGSAGLPTPGQVLIASDQQRLTAWSAASRMFLDQPILGQGYRAYRQLSVDFGDPTLNAPHNEWLRFFAEGGLFVGVLAAGFAVVTSLSLMRRPGWLETGILASFLAFCLAAAFNNPFLFNQVTIPAFILAGTGIALASRPEADPGADG
jgi:O-antigen ligase